MTLQELAEIVGVQLSLIYYPSQNGRWCAQFQDTAVAENGVLTYTHGNGKTPEDAMADYLSRIAGKKMAAFPMTIHRKEFTVPK